MEKTKIALFSFPNREKKLDVYRAWCNKIFKYRRKGGANNFEIMKHTKVCEFHFRPEEIKVSSGCGKKTTKVIESQTIAALRIHVERAIQ